MRFIPIVAALFLVSSLVACGSDDEGSSGDSSCAQLCANGASLNCTKAATCESDCKAQLAQGRTQLKNCTKEFDAFWTCSATKQAAELQCSDEGLPEVKSGVCQVESDALLGCAF